MSYLEEKCSLFPLTTPQEIDGFSCGDSDLDEFFTRDCFAYARELLGKTYCYKLDEDLQKVVCAFTLANAGVRVSDLPNARKKKVESKIPHLKALKDYPAVLLARLGVSKDFRSLNIGSDVIEFVKLWFLDAHNKTGCRFLIVDAYNSPATLAFYEKNDFKMVFSSEQQEKDYRHLDYETALSTRLMFYDLMRTAENYMKDCSGSND